MFGSIILALINESFQGIYSKFFFQFMWLEWSLEKFYTSRLIYFIYVPL